MQGIVTTSSNPSDDLRIRARAYASIISWPYIERDANCKTLLNELLTKEPFLPQLIVGKERLFVIVGDERFYYHPSMSKLRIENLKQGKGDTLLEILDLKPGDTVLDGTLGLASDALVIAYSLFPDIKVIGLEASPLLALLVREGLANLEKTEPSLSIASQAIEVISGNSLDYLKQQKDKSIDVIYFDPMFRHTKRASSSAEILRRLGNPSPISTSLIVEASRVARRKVVLKERRLSQEFSRLGFKEIRGGKYSPVAYGILELKN